MCDLMDAETTPIVKCERREPRVSRERLRRVVRGSSEKRVIIVKTSEQFAAE